jgi:hypothetical protein
MGTLQIVWRNRKRTRRKRRRQELARGAFRRLYVVEELVPQGNPVCWVRAAALEVICGGRVLARRFLGYARSS